MGLSLAWEQKQNELTRETFIINSEKDTDELIERQICEIAETEYSSVPLKISSTIREIATLRRKEFSSVTSISNKINKVL